MSAIAGGKREVEMHVHEVIGALEKIAPLQLAEEWDNVGLLIGDRTAEVAKLMLCIDLTGEVLDEALRIGAGMVLAYHPPIFKNITRVTASDTPVVYSAVANKLAVYSVHTALDAAPGGTNDVLAGAMGLCEARPVRPTLCEDRCKLVVFAPPEALSDVAEAAFAAGAGRIGNYDDCAFFSHGVGTFLPTEGASPRLGTVGAHEAVEEVRLEMIMPRSRVASVCAAVRDAHRYEEPAIDVYPLESPSGRCGMGRVGRLKKPVSIGTLVTRLKRASGCSRVRISWGRRAEKATKVSIAACCAGSCGSLAMDVVAAGATFYVTGEMRHHDALALAAEGVTCLCLGHSNSERMTLKHLSARLRKTLPGLSIVQSRRDADPFSIV